MYHVPHEKMASKQVCRELAAVSLASLPTKLHSYLANVVCKVFKDYSNPNVPPEESTTQQQLVVPLQWMLCGGDPTEMFASLEERKTQSNFCGKVFKSGEPAYFCKDCQTDPTCCLCTECFEQSEHRGHRYRLFASGGGGCCDCGDPEAWTSGVYCQMHKPKEENLEEVDPVESLTPDMADRARVFFSTLLWYCMNLLSWEESKTLPTELMQGHTADCLKEETFLTYLYNDEVHSYDEVIYSLTHNIRLTHTEAVSLATFVDRKGRAVAKRGSETDCLQSRDLVNVGLASSIPLNVMVFHSAVAAHQDNAVLTLQLLKELSEKSVAFRRLISVSLLEVSPKLRACILDRFFLTEARMWISSRINWHRLLMSSIFMDPIHKKDLAINLTKNYCELQKNFVADSHHHDVCASNMTVQLYTVPSLSRMLVSEHHLLEIIIGTLLELLSPCIDQATGTLRLRTDNYKHSRIVYILYDLRYALRNQPEEWTDNMRACVLKAYDLLLKLLGMIQNADAVKRQRGAHIEREDPWEHTFNFSIVLQPAVLLLINWCISDQKLLEKAVKVTLKKHEVLSSRAKLPYKDHSVDQDLVGRRKMELIAFDIMKEHVSVHQPLARVLACLLTGATVQHLPLTHFLQTSPTDVRTPLFLMEHSSRAVVMAVQVLAGMWKRNGYSVVNQVINYQFYYSKGIMYDKDILMLQTMAAIMDPSVFMYALIYKFRLETWLTCPDSDPTTKRGETSEDALRFFICEAEEFLFLIITIYAERYSPNVGVDVTTTDVLRREIIHRLYIAPLSHSEILKQFRLSEVENEIDKLLKKVAVLKRGVGAGKSVFELKKEFEKEFNPFFYHYTRVDHSKAEDAHRKKTKAAGGISRVAPAPPRRPPSFCEPYQGILKLSYCPVLHKVLHCVFKQAASAESKFWSDRLLHEALYLCALMLLEECATDPKSLFNAATGKCGKYAFLNHLELLLPNQRAEEHRPLLTWIIQFLKSQGPDGAVVTEPEEAATPVEDDVQAAKEKLKEKAKARVKAHMSSMQKKYLEKNWKAIEEVDSDDLQPAVPGEKATSPQCAVGIASLLDHRPSPQEVTCILCQEKTKDFAEEFGSQSRMFVQTVSVQKSTVLRRCKPSNDSKDVDFLSARADLPCGMYSGGCGHHVHSDCWKRFLDNKQQEHGRRHFFPIPGQSVQWHMGEFLCPLCQCFGNAVLPLLPLVKVSPEVVKVPRKELGFADWRVLVNMALEMAENDTMDDGSSVDPTFHDKLCGLFPYYRKPQCHYDKSTTGDQTEIEAFSQIIYMHAYSVDPDETSDRVCLAQWNNCTYTIASLEMNARIQGKFLLETLSSRQVDNISSLVRLGCETKVRPSLDTLGNYLRHLFNSFLLQTPPFTEFPSILEIDSFSMMTNLHFTITSLFASLSSATGSLDDNPVIVPLMGITDEFLLRICTAAKVVQYLLTCSPAMETDAAGQDVDQVDSSSLELSSGQGLQRLWIKFRKLACLSYDCPPTPEDLYDGLKNHLCPLLQCCALFFHSLSHIDFTHSSGQMSRATVFHDLCQYLGLPSAIHTLFEPPVSPVKFSISHLAELWCSHPRLAKLATSSTLPPVVVTPRELVSLPTDFSELVKKASAFKCPNRVVAAEYSDSGQEAMMCLVCGAMLCTNSYCCRHPVEGVDEETGVGGFTNHTQSCGAGMGMALWILESYVVLLDATDITDVKGCTVTPPYLDEYGEPDTGLRRGNPLQLNPEGYRELQELWHLNKIPERIHKEMESNKGLRLINWSRM